MNYSEVKDYLLSPEMNVSLPGLDRIKQVLAKLGNIQNNLKIVHVVGTNGKGSTSTMLAKMFGNLGLKVGMFNSPYITELTEYITVYNWVDDNLLSNNIDTDSFVRISNDLKQFLSENSLVLTHFEFVTVLSVLYFNEIDADICIYEAGMGGEHDATNIFEDCLCTSIASICLEHEKFLGNNLYDITLTKASICNNDGMIVSMDYNNGDKEIVSALNYIADKINISLYGVESVFNYSFSENGIVFDYKKYKDLFINTNALYQLKNASLAIDSFEKIIENNKIVFKNINVCKKNIEAAIRSSLKQFYIKSRFEIIKKEPLIIIDGAHNPGCIDALTESLNNNYRDQKFVLITGVMRDKDYDYIYDKLNTYVDSYICIDNNIPRALPSSELCGFLKKYNKPVYNAKNTFMAACIAKSLSLNCNILYSGSLYFSDSIKNDLGNVFDEDFCLSKANEVINRLTSTDFYSKNYSLEDMKKILELYDNPQEKIKYIHIAGTNGKGSTSKMLYELVKNNGYKTGLFTSPYIEVFNERIIFENNNIPNDFLISCAEEVFKTQKALGIELNQFALLTCIAFIYYEIVKADYVILETGLGGTYDPTNIINKPLCSVITNIGLDHTAVLGNTIEEIAEAKAGIIKNECPVVVYPLDENIAKVFYDKAKSLNAPITFIDKSNIEFINNNEKDELIDINNRTEVVDNNYRTNLIVDNNCIGNRFKYKNIKYVLALNGEFQIYNACNAIETYSMLANTNKFDISDLYINRILSTVTWKGRMELISKNPLVYVDGGHNPQCVDAVANFLKYKFSNIKKIIIAGFMKDKDYSYMINELYDISDYLVLTPVSYGRSLSVEELKEFVIKNNFQIDVAENLSEAYNLSLEAYNDNSVILICGSLYQLKEAYKIVKNK